MTVSVNGKCSACASKGGPALPQDISPQDCCLRLYFYPDNFTVEITNGDALKMSEALAFTKVRPDAPSTNCVATCCSTIILVDNRFYHQGGGSPGSTDGSACVVFCHTLTPTGVAAEPQIRWIKDIPETKLAENSVGQERERGMGTGVYR